MDKGMPTEQITEFQTFIMKQLSKIGITIHSNQGIEIKYDPNFQKTGNLYIETAEMVKSENTKFVHSGIFKNDNSWLYIIGDYKNLYLFATKYLRSIYPKRKSFVFVSEETTQGYLMPVAEAEQFCIKYIDLADEIQK